MHKPFPTMVRVETPISYIAKRWTPSVRTAKRAALTAVVMSVFIIITGGAVRLTGSGLGCDTWPKCTDDSLFATPEQGLHGAIEFGNRMLTYVLSAAVGWAIIAARSLKPRRRGLTRLAWSQFWLVMGNAVIGGITVWAGLNPWSVAGHFLLANCLLTVAVLTWVRIGEGDGAPAPARPAPGAAAVLGDRRHHGRPDRARHHRDRLRQARGRQQRRTAHAVGLERRRPCPRRRRLGRLRAGRSRCGSPCASWTRPSTPGHAPVTC